jgi:hypothetical protein
MKNNSKKARLHQIPESEISLANIGLGEVAYVREVQVEDVERLTGHKLQVAPDSNLWCLYLADGTPVSVSDSHEAALANAWEHDLSAISVH